jgi:hypothetical protein
MAVGTDTWHGQGDRVTIAMAAFVFFPPLCPRIVADDTLAAPGVTPRPNCRDGA